jgi:hypothetical protein
MKAGIATALVVDTRRTAWMAVVAARSTRKTASSGKRRGTILVFAVWQTPLTENYW